MWGKHYDSMYSGSMVGKGFAVFSLMGYVVANMKPDRTVGFQIELNSILLATIFGEPQKRIEEAIGFLCSPDPESRSPAEEGRRLVKIGKFAYRVVNGKAYDQIRNEEDRREQCRIAQQRYRDKNKSNPMKPSTGLAHIPDGGVAKMARAEDKAEADAQFNPVPA